jgi:hypothetical protein
MSHIASDADIERIGRGLMDLSLPKSEWTHAAHFAAALWLLRRPDMNATRDMPGFIRAYNAATGVPNTDTGGYRAWLAARSHLSLHTALEELMASPFGRSDWMLGYWTKPVLFSVAARRGWIGPDRKPLPF